jgi:hypothetical protein
MSACDNKNMKGHLQMATDLDNNTFIVKVTKITKKMLMPFKFSPTGIQVSVFPPIQNRVKQQTIVVQINCHYEIKCNHITMFYQKCLPESV